MIKVAFLNRDPSWWLGGDVIYINKTIESLKKLGHNAEYVWREDADLGLYDIVHLVHCTHTWAYSHYKNAKEQGKKIVLSPIYYPLCKEEFRIEIFNGVDFIVSSSERERNMLIEVGVLEGKIDLIPRGTSSIFYQQVCPCENYVLGVGRWDICKRQWDVIEACRDLNIPYVGVGPLRSSDVLNKVKSLGYGKMVMKEASVTEMVRYYSGAKVVVIASDWEEFGLPLLEGGLNGCNLVVNNLVGGAEWFQDIAIYKFGDREDMKRVIYEEFNAERDHKGYRNYVRDNFLWDTVTKRLVDIYERV